MIKRLIALYLVVMMCLSTNLIECFAITTSYTPSDSYKSGKYYQNLLSVKLSGDQAKDLVAVAMSQVGYHEGTGKSDMDGVSNGGGKYTEYGYMHGDASAQWCAYFVSWCARQARIPTSLIPKSGGAGAAKSANGTYYDVSSGYIPKAGDLIFYEPSKGVASRNTATGIPKGTSHVNICYKDGTDGKIHMIGGNEEGKVRKSDYPLPKKVGNWQNIQGYFHPNYSKDTTTDNNGNDVSSIINSVGILIGVSAGNASDITANNVTLSGSCTKPSTIKLTNCGVYIGTSTSNMTKRVTQNVSEASNNMNGGTGFTMTYNASTNLGMTLSANTKYYYQFYVTYGTTELKSDVKSFTTPNAYKIIEQKAVLIIPKGKTANGYSTVTGNKVIGTYGSADAQRLLLPSRYADLADGTRRFEMVATDGTSYWVPYDSSFMTLQFLPTSIAPAESHIYLKAEEGESYYPEFNQYPANSYDSIEFSYSEDDSVAFAYQRPNGVLEIVANGVGTTDLYFKAYRTKLTTKITVTVVDGGPPMFGDISIEKDDAGSYTVTTTATDTNMSRIGVAVWHEDDGDIKETPNVTWYDVSQSGSLMTDNFTYVKQSADYIVTYEFDRDDLGPFSGDYVAAVYAEDSEGGLSRTEIGFVETSSYDQEAFPFEDVTNGDWFYEGIYYNYLKGTMTGMNEDNFGPYGNLSRAQFALMLYRLEGQPEYTTSKTFHDISGNEWYGPAVLWAAENGIVTGYQNGNFGPVDMITREQMAVMMYRYVNYLELDSSQKVDFNSFLDAASVSPFAADAMSWAVGSGIITGKQGGTLLDPQGNTTRSEAAIILQRYMQ